MRAPLIRQGEGPAAALERVHAERLAEAKRIREIVEDTSVRSDAPSRATAGGDERKLRGIPCVGRGVAGAIPGSSPHSVAA